MEREQHINRILAPDIQRRLNALRGYVDLTRLRAWVLAMEQEAPLLDVQENPCPPPVLESTSPPGPAANVPAPPSPDATTHPPLP